ncbi:MAG: hypothetical protein FJY65_04015 [Calditrichaeota bacterium]|nr:hypothetical protein [Calditrichota bacterium]
MRRLTYAGLICLACSLAALADGRALRSTASNFISAHFFQPQAETLALAGIQIKPQDGGFLLAWQEALRRKRLFGESLTGYIIQVREASGAFIRTDFSALPEYFYRPTIQQRAAYFSVYALYGGRSNLDRELRQVRRDGRILLDFEEGEFDFESYNEAEDRQPDSVQVTDREAAGQSRRSLRLYGNTWKRMPLERTDITDTTVWQISVLSIDGDTSAEMQAFGLSDGVQELFYPFFGRETYWQHSWQSVNQEARRRGVWQTFKLNVGYDWTGRFGYEPRITQLLFVNDNDTTNPPAQVYFDQLLDITGDIAFEPKPKFRWRIEPNVEVAGTVVCFTANVENRNPNDVDLLWDFSDGNVGRGFEPVKVFRDGIYSVGLTAVGREGLIGRAMHLLEIGNVRLPANLSLAFTGDVMLARRYEDQGGIIPRFGPEAVFARIRHRTIAADLFVINLESPLTDEGAPHPCKEYVFRGSPQNVAGLVYAGVDIATLANNHLTDYGDRGLEETIEVLDAARILHCGANINEYRALQPVFKTLKGMRIGILAYCNRTGRDGNERPYLDAGYDKPGYAYFSADNIVNSVPQAASQCDLLVVSVHGGREYAVFPMAEDPTNPYPPWHEENYIYRPPVDSATRELSHLAIDLGAGLVIQHHPHVLQGFEVYNGVVIAASLGNFAFDQNIWETWPSALVWVDYARSGVQAVGFEPVFVDNYYPTPAVGQLGAKIINRLADYSTPLNCFVVPEYHCNRARIVFEPNALERICNERTVSGSMRRITAEGVYRSEPLRLDGGGFVSAVNTVLPEAMDAGWQARLGREILWFGGLEKEGGEVWNFNSQFEGRDSTIMHSGRYSAWLRRNVGQQDGVTDLIQRIPVFGLSDALTLMGWLRLENARDAALAVRWYRYRNDNQPQNIYGDTLVEGRFSGNRDWFYVWKDLRPPNNNTAFVNPRWQLFAPQAGSGWLWTDDIELVRWDEWRDFTGQPLYYDYPSELFYLQVQTRRPVETVQVRYSTVTLSMSEQ